MSVWDCECSILKMNSFGSFSIHVDQGPLGCKLIQIQLIFYYNLVLKLEVEIRVNLT